MQSAVTDEQVAAYRQAVEGLAYRYIDVAVMCEFDDLVQEGLIAVWESLCDGQPPSTEYIKLAMRQYRRKMWRLRRGDTLADDFVYEAPVGSDSLHGE